jgi:hypothetical protein
LGGCRQKPIGALNSARIAKKVELKKFQKAFHYEVTSPLGNGIIKENQNIHFL